MNHLKKLLKFEGEMKVESTNFDSNDKNNNRYKRCPNCGIIWFKIKGRNYIKWENRTKRINIFYRIFKTYIVKFTRKFFNIITLKDEQVDTQIDNEFFRPTEEEKTQNLNRVFKHKIVPEGCGIYLNLGTLEDVTNIVNE